MWGRLRERHLNAVGMVLAIVWFFASMAIATGPLGVEPARSNLWIVVLIFLAPFAPLAVVSVIKELVHGVKHGPSKPGRHSRGGALDLDELHKLDADLKRRIIDGPEK